MNPDSRSSTGAEESIDLRHRGEIDRLAYVGIGIYSLINVVWIVWAFAGAGFGIFHTAGLIGILVPILGLLSLIVFQSLSRQNRFSVLANALSIIVLVGWFFAIWYIVTAASAAV